MKAVDDYIATLSGAEQVTVQHVYDIALQMVPDAEQAIYYNMACLKYKGKGLISCLANKDFLSVYPFGSVENLGVDVSGFETTKGSIHLSVERPIPDATLRAILTARLQQING